MPGAPLDTPHSRRVLCVGEVVWDLFPDGERLGGAPFNVAVHLARHGIPTTLLTALGRDPRGQAALAFLQAEGLPGPPVHPSAPTGTVEVRLDPAGSPQFRIQEACAWMHLDWAHPMIPERATCVVFGSLALHSRSNRLGLERYVRQTSPPWRLCDLNLRPGWPDPVAIQACLSLANVLKVNADEWRHLKAFLGLDGDLRKLLIRLPLRAVCLTQGSEGLHWVDADGTETRVPALEPAGGIIDTVGAGDAVTAALAAGLVQGEPPLCFLEKGAQWAAQVCGQAGAL
jgi:fructokinase